MKYIIAIIVINFLVYVGVNIASFQDVSLIQYLALSRSTFLSEPWTIFTYMFTHTDFFALFFNMLILFVCGRAFLRRQSGESLLAIYLIGGLLGGVVIMLFSAPMFLTIGSLGAIFAVLATLTIIEPHLNAWFIPLWIVTIFLFLGLALLPGQSWQGELGGLIAGLLFGLYRRISTPKQDSRIPR